MWEARWVSRTSEDDWNDIQLCLDILSCFPIALIPAQGANILIDIIRGEYKEALIRAGSIVLITVGVGLVFKTTGALIERFKNLTNVAEMRSVLQTMDGAYQQAGLTAKKIDEILSIVKGSRPNPSSYLPSNYIASHLAKFEGGVSKIMSYTPTGTAGPAGGTFVMPKSLVDDMIMRANGNVSKLEELLGLNPGDPGTSPVCVDIPSPSGLRMPSGNELGANSQWVPGGYTSGGIPEAVIDSPVTGTYSVSSIF